MKPLSDKRIWKTSRHAFDYADRTLVMGVLNVTPDSFSDGGRFQSPDDALRHAEALIEEGADIIDIGGESTRPESKKVDTEEEIRRVVPIITAIGRRFDIPISVDTSKSKVAERAVEAGAQAINDISGLLFDEKIAEIASRHKTGLILMHLRGDFDSMHHQEPVKDIMEEVSSGFFKAIEKAKASGVTDDQLCLDVGIGFSKTQKQNLELIAKFEVLSKQFRSYPIMIGISRKSFIGKITGQPLPAERLYSTVAANAISVWNGASIVRVHDVKLAVETLRLVEEISRAR